LGLLRRAPVGERDCESNRTGSSIRTDTHVKIGPLIGFIGLNVLLLNLGFEKPQWAGVALGACGALLLIVGTVLTGVQKGRTGLGVLLSPLAVVFGLGLVIIVLVPAKERRDLR